MSEEDRRRHGEQYIKGSRQEVDTLARQKKATNGDNGLLRLHHGVRVDGGLGAAGATVSSLRAVFLRLRHI